jgi:thiamine transporter ThiT
MKRLLPNGLELMILAAVALFTSLIASRVGPEDPSLALVMFPMLLMALLMGARRKWKPQPAPQVATVSRPESMPE